MGMQPILNESHIASVIVIYFGLTLTFGINGPLLLHIMPLFLIYILSQI